MIKFWQKYKHRVRANCIGEFSQSDGLDYWRNKLFATIIIYLLPLGLIILAPSAIIVYYLDIQALTAAYILFGIAISVISLYGRMPISLRKYLFLALIYTVSTMLIFYMGEHGAGLTYLFAATVFTLLILPTKAGVLTIFINTGICLVHAALIYHQAVEYPLRDSYQVASWLAISGNSILLSIVAVVFMPMLFSGLQKTISSQNTLQKNLMIHQDELKDSLNEKETLLAEIHHRVKNNLAVVSGMLQLQAYKETNELTQQKLLNSTLRIKSMANIHEQLYQSHSFSNLSFDEGLKKLVQTIVATIENEAEINVQFELDAVELNINQAVPCSLIVNEVITNIIKHAFPEQERGAIVITLKEKDNQLDLRISDDGIGMPEDIQNQQNTSLGMELIHTLCLQLEADYTYRNKSSGPGTEFELKFTMS